MKLTTNSKELKELNACTDGYKIFIDAHGGKDATLSQCLESNGWDDIWWLISKVYDQLSDKQKVDLRLLACDYALLSIDNFEKEYPDDKRPRLAIEASQAYAKGEISKDELDSAWSAAWSAAESAWSAKSAKSAAWSAVWSAAWSAKSAKSAARSAAESAARSAKESAAWSAEWSAARSAAWSAAWSTAEATNSKMLMDVLLKWESEA